ncbi:MAG: hypothetical protein AMS20_10805 [Gemmatimonas sp. SG8_28]|nr:MAG: hypothetical protein AMS20_10805 [Gemmatimonas sp. SG8_28]
MRLQAACSIGAILLLTSCQAASFDPEDPEIIAAIDSVMQSVMAGAAAADVDQVLAAAEGEGELTFITGEVMLTGLETIRARFEDSYAPIQSQQQEVLEKRVRILSPEVAIVMAVAEGTYTDKAGWTSDPVGIGTTLVFVRENGQWRIRHAHQSIVR